MLNSSPLEISSLPGERDEMKESRSRRTIPGERHRLPPLPRLGILLGEKRNPFWRELKGHFARLAPEMGFRLAFFWPSPGGDDIQGQTERLRRMLYRKFDLIIINPLTPTNLTQGILLAGKLGIPVLDVGAKTDPETAARARPFYHPVHTVDFYRQGVLGAEYMLRKMKGWEDKRVVILDGRRKAAQSRGRSQGAADTFAQDPSVQIVKRQPADFDRRKAQRLAARVLAEDPEVNGFFCANDSMALGVAEAVRRLKRKRPVLIVGVDLIHQARRAIRENLMQASVAFSTASVARAVLNSARKILKGRPLSGRYLVKSSIVHKTNLNSWEAANLEGYIPGPSVPGARKIKGGREE